VNRDFFYTALLFCVAPPLAVLAVSAISLMVSQ
jgi:hypothetical protein